MQLRRIARTVAATALMVIAVATTTGATAATPQDRELRTAAGPEAIQYDDLPCLGEWWHAGVGQWVQTCPDWGPAGGPWGDRRIPVYDINTRQVIDTIYAPGDDWYDCQIQFAAIEPYKYGAYYNDHWAWTKGDGGRWGWVPEVFFKGGGNMEADRKLQYCW